MEITLSVVLPKPKYFSLLSIPLETDDDSM